MACDCNCGVDVTWVCVGTDGSDCMGMEDEEDDDDDNDDDEDDEDDDDEEEEGEEDDALFISPDGVDIVTDWF
ncbi:zinc finger protein [Reticulomyxa filosa]|uniref:Zinc finger protein n=1 Tax=Reticulomyxa filosa TaxID=46433 RepID=X6N1K2_RETFI|nr:zinc finger protein [Reticulomyxa filosa]|eukprot:ETO19916.1 zinc finger protein [Reticulomyxa filosa]